jgi:hypothetical protein
MRVETTNSADSKASVVLANSEIPDKEQRRFRRYSVSFPCEVKSAKQSGKRISTTTQDVSCGGLYFSVPTEWEIGTPVEFVLYLPLKAAGSKPVALRCQGKVARIVEREEQRYGIGATIERFEFIHLDSKGKGEKMETGFPDLSGSKIPFF